MQTFMPMPDFRYSARVLDDRRLGKQRVEAMQIHKALLALRANSDHPEPTRVGWTQHPAVRMWRGYEDALVHYAYAICLEWATRGHEDNVLGYFEPHYRLGLGEDPYDDPPWMGWEEFHASHRAMLYQKDPVHYVAFLSDFEAAGRDPHYVWPTDRADKFVDTGRGLRVIEGVKL